MIIQGMIDQCDFTQQSFDGRVMGGHCLARGATGRVCCVMYISMDEMDRMNLEFNTREEAERWALDHPNGSIDF